MQINLSPKQKAIVRDIKQNFIQIKTSLKISPFESFEQHGEEKVFWGCVPSGKVWFRFPKQTLQDCFTADQLSRIVTKEQVTTEGIHKVYEQIKTKSFENIVPNKDYPPARDLAIFSMVAREKARLRAQIKYQWEVFLNCSPNKISVKIEELARKEFFKTSYLSLDKQWPMAVEPIFEAGPAFCVIHNTTLREHNNDSEQTLVNISLPHTWYNKIYKRGLAVVAGNIVIDVVDYKNKTFVAYYKREYDSTYFSIGYGTVSEVDGSFKLTTATQAAFKKAKQKKEN